MEKIMLLATITTFSVLILSGTTLNLSQRIQTRLRSDKTTSNEDFFNAMIKSYKIIAWVGVIIYLTTLKLNETRVNFNVTTIVLIGCIVKYFYITSDDREAYLLNGEFVEHPLSVTLDVLTNLGIAIQSIVIFIQL